MSDVEVNILPESNRIPANKERLVIFMFNDDGLDNMRQDRSDNIEGIDAGKSTAAQDGVNKQAETESTRSAGEENSSGEHSQQNVYSVGGESGAEDNYTAPRSNCGEYSYGSKDQIPDYRYTYTPHAQQAPQGKLHKPKKARKHRSFGKTGVIALIATAAILFAGLAGFGGAMLAKSINDNGNQPSDGIQETSVSNETTAGTDSSLLSPGSSDASSAIIIKSNSPVTVETVAGNIGDTNLTLPDVVTLVKDSVVEISTETSVYSGRYVVSGAGSGVIIGRSEDGKTVYVATNNHVIADADSITVRLTNGNEYKATLRGTDPSSDVAVLIITVDEPVTVAQLGTSQSLLVGESVIAIGNPLGELGGSVTNGIISALARAVEIDGTTMTLLQTNAAVNPGNSGGGLFNMRGELIGIVNAKSSGADIDNIGFAIPIDTAYDVIKELIEYGYVTGRVDAGLTLIDITDTYSAWYYGVSTLGVYVYESKYTDEIKSGDRVVSVNGVEVSTSGDITSEINDCNVGDTITVRVSRKGKQYDIKLTLQEYVPTTVASEPTK